MIAVLPILISVLAIFFGFKLLIYLKYRERVNGFPGPIPKSLVAKILGNGLDMSYKRDETFKQLREVAVEMKETYHFWGGYFACLNVVEPDDIEILLSSMKHSQKGMIYTYLHPWLKEGLLTSYGKKWQQRRKVLTPAFHFNILKRFAVIMEEHSQRLIEDLKSARNEKINVVSLMSNTALNIICEAAMGTNLDDKDEAQSNYRKALYGLAPIIVERVQKFWLYYDFTFYMTKISRLQRKFLKILHGFTRKVIMEREKNFKREDVENLEDDDMFMKKKKRLAMLDLLIDAKRSSNEIDDDGICEEVDTFTFEGHDTSAAALSFILLLLANHKDVQDKVYQEISDTFGSSVKIPTVEDLQGLRYLDMVIKECLRVYPSVPFISRHLTAETQLKNHIAPANIDVFIHIYDLHRNPQIYPDPEKFDPDRFLPENCQGRHPYAYIPFSAGPRNCIGQKFALLEIKNIVTSILKNFILEPVTTPKDIVLLVDVVLRTENPIYVKFKSRN